jgi:uncharacterized protein YbjQ (UPF0145 family)
VTTAEPGTGRSDGKGVDLQAEMLAAARSLGGPEERSGPSTTSDLSIDEELILHSIGWEPIELVCGMSLHSVPMGVWNWGQGEITYASEAYQRSFAKATDRIHNECAKAGGHGVVGVHVEWSAHRHHVDVTLTGTAVRPVGSKRVAAQSVFVSDLSGRDFTLLHSAGWAPLGLAAGASFVYAPRRSIGTTMKQKGLNVELTNFTEAMYSARESAMERMQRSALDLGGTGVVEVKVTEGPMDFARHAVSFTAYGTVVHLVADEHQRMQPIVVVPLDDAVRSFDATSLRGR